jgi:hypothetical protein
MRVIIEQIPTYKQGGITNAEMATGNYQENSQQPNINVEHGEHTKNSETGAVKEVVGKKHTQGGEDINLPDQSKVLSDYTKIGATNAKVFEEMFDVKLKASDTFATVLDRYNNKIGIKGLEEEEKELVKKVEKNSNSSIEKKTKQINEDFLAQEIAEINKKKKVLNKIKAQAFEAIFNEQEKIPKKGDGSQVLDKSGKPMAQQGGVTEERLKVLAEQYGTTPEHIFEILQARSMKQEGGEQQSQGQPDPQQIIQAYAQMAGQDPNQVVQQLQQMPPEEQQAALQQMLEVLQQGQQAEQPQMRDGGKLKMYQEASVTEDPNKPYTFSTQYTPPVAGYTVTGSSVLNQPTLSDVEFMQHYTGKGYGQKMADIDKAIGTHDWYFNTEEKKKDFKEAAMKQDSRGVVKEFQNAYNIELSRRAREAGLSTEEITSAINNVGFTGKGVQQLDDKFGAFTSTRPMFSFKKEEEPVVDSDVTGSDTIQNINKPNRDIVKNIISTEGLPYIMPPSASIAPYLQQVNLSRLEGQKGSVENQLAASENARQAAYQATRGLPPAQAAAMMANYLATSGQQDTAGIAQQEIQDLGNKSRIEQYNAGQSDKEQILNEQLKKQYEREAFGTLNVNEQSWRNYYDASQANQKALFDKIDRRNIMNLGLTNYQLNGSGGFDFVNQSPFQNNSVTFSNTGALNTNQYTPEAIKKAEEALKTMKAQAQLTKKTK